MKLVEVEVIDFTDNSYYQYEQEDFSKYQTARDAGFVDRDNLFCIGDSGGFLMKRDFIVKDTHLFSETSAFKVKHDTYSLDAIDTPEYANFRRREEDRRKNGLTRNCLLYKKDIEDYNNAPKDVKREYLHPLTISGAHYNFLNYAPILKLDYSSVKSGSKAAKKITGFPRFMIGQFWYFKCREFARDNGLHMVIGKSRRGGFSYMEASDSANEINLNPNYTVLHTAYDKKYLITGNAMTVMTKTYLDFYERHTPFVRGYLSEEIENIELGYKPANSHMKLGYRSKLVSVSFGNNPDVAIGKDASYVKIEELSNTPNLDAFLSVTVPTISTGSFVTGQIVGFGTGGSTAGDWEKFEQWFYEPGKWGAMKFENVWDENMRHTVCGYFKPFWEGLEGKNDLDEWAMDKDGNSNYLIAMNISAEGRRKKKKETTVAEYVIYCGQYANKPSESFSAGSENLFARPELSFHVNRLKADKSLQFWRDGMFVRNTQGELVFRTNDWIECNLEKGFVHPYIEDVPFKKGSDLFGCFREYHPPYKEKGKVPKGLYRIWYDPTGVSKEKNTVTAKNSLACAIVYMRNNNFANTTGDIIVGCWCGRRDNLSDENKLVLDIAEAYGAEIMHENDRGTLINDCRQWKKLQMLAPEPNIAWDASLQTKSGRTYGLNMTTQRKLSALQYLVDWLYTDRTKDENGTPVMNLHYIYDLPLLTELQKWSIKGNFDRVSTLLVGMYDIKEICLTELKKTLPNSNTTSIFKRMWFGQAASNNANMNW